MRAMGKRVICVYCCPSNGVYFIIMLNTSAENISIYNFIIIRVDYWSKSNFLLLDNQLIYSGLFCGQTYMILNCEIILSNNEDQC